MEGVRERKSAEELLAIKDLATSRPFLWKGRQIEETSTGKKFYVVDLAFSRVGLGTSKKTVIRWEDYRNVRKNFRLVADSKGKKTRRSRKSG